MPVKLDPDRIARNPRLWPRQKPVLAQKTVDQRRFPHIRASRNRNPERTIDINILVLDLDRRSNNEFALLALLRNNDLVRPVFPHRQIERVEPLAMFRRHRDRIPEPELECFVTVQNARLALRLVGEQDHRLRRTPNAIGKMLVGRGQTRARIDHKKNNIGRFNRPFRLPAHPVQQRVGKALFQPRRIHNNKIQIAEMALAFAPVTCDTGAIIDERELFPDKTVEKRRFTNIRSADQCDRDSHDVKTFCSNARCLCSVALIRAPPAQGFAETAPPRTSER